MRALVFASLLALAACDTATVDTESADAAGIVGTWDWERSTYYETASGQPVTHTPATAGYTETYVFDADGSVAIYLNGALERSAPYAIRRRVYANGTQSEDVRLIIGDHDVGFDVSGDRLVLDDRSVDGPLAHYRRR